MTLRNILGKALSAVFRPIGVNARFFVFLYVLGVVCAWLTLPPYKTARLYHNLYLELFFDLYVLCALLMLIPKRVRRWVRGVVAVVLYVLAIIDVYCYVKFGSTITPTMLLLVGETDEREASEFVASFFSSDVVFGKVGWLLLITLAHIACAVWGGKLQRVLGSPLQTIPEQSSPTRSLSPRRGGYSWVLGALAGLATLVLLIWSSITSWPNKQAFWRMMNLQTPGQVEAELNRPDCVNCYESPYRLAFSIRSNQLAAKQIDRLIEVSNSVQVDSCSYRSPHIVLIIGESFGRHHSQQYGYFMPTTPRQIQRERTGLLVPFTDVVASWNLTSFVFKSLFSMHVVGQEGEWCDYPLFPELFRKAGYDVTFLTNQFLPKAKEAVYDFSGGFFLNNPELSAAMFDHRNEKTHIFDEGLLAEYDKIKDEKLKMKDDKSRLTIFHLLGQHLNYRTRCPNSKKHFKPEDYNERRPELNAKQRRLLSDYDNACLYNDSIVDQICRRMENEEAIVIYMPDHGEECYEGTRGIICRNHSAEIDRDLARYEFEIPFWIWCSPRYAAVHPEVFKQVIEARQRPLMTDAIAHTLLYLAGIESSWYKPEYDVLSADYNDKRPRILKNTTDYDQLAE